MSARQVWGRLLWKEFREGRFVLLVAALAPLLIRAGWHAGSKIAFAMMVVPAIGIHLAIAFWATSRGGSRRSGGEFSWTHLPTSPAVEWLASMIIPAIVIAGLGAWFGWLAAPPTVNEVRSVPVAVAGILDLTTTFVICYLVSMVVSSWAAYIIGVFRLIGGTLISVWNLSLMLEGDAVQTVARTLIGAIIGAFIYVVPFRKKSVAFRQAASLISVVLITFIPLVPQIPIGDGLQKLIATRYGNDFLYENTRTSGDGSVRVRPAKDSRKVRFKLYQAGKEYLVLRDYRRNITRKRLFSFCYVFDAQPSGRVYMASSTPGRVGVRITEWDGVTDRVRTVATLPIRGRQVWGDGWQHSLSPDGKYMALMLKSLMLSSARDLWLVDLSGGNARIALPDLEQPTRDSSAGRWDIAWPKGKVAVWDSLTGAVVVDIKTLETRRITFNSEASKL